MRVRLSRYIAPHATIAAILLLSSLAAGAPPAAESGRYGIHSKTLDNGMDVIAIVNPALPVVTIEIAVKNGAYTEPPEFSGLSHLYEHMFFKGNAVLSNQEIYDERARELGAEYNGSTGDEMVNYFLTLHKKNLREGTAFLRDALLYPLFSEEELRREWPVVLGEFDRNEADPDFHLRREIDRRLWFKYFNRKNPIGDREVIFNATRAQMREIQRRYYVPNNSALLVAGDVRPEEVFEMAQELFGAWKRGDDPHARWPEPEHPPLAQTSRIAVSGPVKTVSLNIAWQGPGMKADTPSTFAADVLAYVLGQPDSNFQKALVDSGLVDGVGLSYSSLVHTGPIELSAVTSADRLDKAWKAIEDELGKIPDAGYISDEQIESAKNMIEINEIYSRERTTSFVHSIAFWWCTGGLDYYLNYIDNLRAITRKDIVKYYETYIKDKPRIEAVLAGKADLAKVDFAKTAELIEPQSGSSTAAFAKAAGAHEATTEEFEVDGLKVILRRNPGSEIVAASMTLDGGLSFYGPEKAGRELVLLEALDKGSKGFTKEEVNRQLARTGGVLSAEARHDYSAFSLQTLKRDLDKNFAIYSDALTHPLLTDDEIKLGLERRLSGIKMQEESPDAFIPVLASRNFYKGHPYEVPPTGTESALKDVDAAGLRKLHKDTFIRERMKLILVADISGEEATRLVESGLKDVPHGKFDVKTPKRPNSDKPRLLVEERKLPTNYILGSFDAPSQGDADFPAFEIAASILSDRLFKEIRTRRNLSYAVAAQVSSRRANYGALYITTVKPAEALGVMLAEVDRIRNEPISEKELRDKIEEMITGQLVSNQTSRSQCNRLLLYEMNGGGWQRESGALDRLRSVTPGGVQEAARKYLKGFNFAVLGDRAKIDKALFTSR